MRKTSCLTTIIIILNVLGCATPADHRYVNEKHILKKININDKGYFEEYYQSVNDQTNQSLAINYFETGITLSRSACYKHLDALAAKDNNTKYGKEQFGILVILGSGILGINEADSDDFTRLALGAAAINSSIDLYDNYYLLGPDADIVVDKVKEAMEQVYKEASKTPPANFKQAYVKIESYARVCSSTSIRKLVRNALEEAEFVADTTLEDTNTQIMLDNIAAIFNRSGLNDDQYFAIYWEVFETPANSSTRSEMKKLLGDIPLADVTNSAQELKKYYRQIPETMTAYANKLKELRQKIRKLNESKQEEIEAESTPSASFQTQLDTKYDTLISNIYQDLSTSIPSSSQKPNNNRIIEVKVK